MTRLVQVRRVENNHIESILRSPVQVTFLSSSRWQQFCEQTKEFLHLTSIHLDARLNQLWRDSSGPLHPQSDRSQIGRSKVQSGPCEFFFVGQFFGNFVRFFAQASLYPHHLWSDDLAVQVGHSIHIEKVMWLICRSMTETSRLKMLSISLKSLDCTKGVKAELVGSALARCPLWLVKIIELVFLELVFINSYYFVISFCN